MANNKKQKVAFITGITGQDGAYLSEFLYVDDLAKAVVFALEQEFPEHLYNVGTGKDFTIRELAETIQSIVGHQGAIIWDSTKPDGTPRKLMDVSKLKGLGWQYQTELKDGVKQTYQWFLEHQNNFKEVKI